MALPEMIRGKVYVLGDNIDTDQIIPAEHLVFNPAIAEERKMFGRYALCGVPPSGAGLPQGGVRFVADGKEKSEFRVIIGGSNFGCGSSREHAPLALAEAGVAAVIAESYARIFYRNSVNGGYLVPLECAQRLSENVKTGDEVEIDLKGMTFQNLTNGYRADLSPLGDIAPILAAGDIFTYAKKSGMLS